MKITGSESEFNARLVELRSAYFRELRSPANPQGAVFLDSMAAPLAPLRNGGGSRHADHDDDALATSDRGRIAATIAQLGNPHSSHRFGFRSHDTIEAMRHRTLELLGAEREYDVVFTANCTHAIHIVASLFPFTEQSECWVHQFAHNSLLGVREMLPSDRCFHPFLDAIPIPQRDNDGDHPHYSAHNSNSSTSGDGCGEAREAYCGDHLLCVPMECNFSGFRPDVANLIRQFRQRHAARSSSSPGRTTMSAGESRSFVLVDGAAAFAKHEIRLDNSGIDFLALSFYKSVGFPTGVGALLVRRGAAQELCLSQKRYFGGGTVASNVFRKRRGHELRHRFVAAMEDGTPNFQGIAALAAGFEWIERFGSVRAIEAHLAALRRWCVESLRSLVYPNGSPLVVVYNSVVGTTASNAADEGKVCRGSSVAFSVLDEESRFIGHALVEKLLAGHGILLRGGCFCNPGACEHFVGYGEERIRQSVAAGHACWDDMDLVDGFPTGCLRASFAAYTTYEDVDELVRGLRNCFLFSPSTASTASRLAISSATATAPEVSVASQVKCVPSRKLLLRIRSITVFPVKGLPGVAVDSWPLTRHGLWLDREWMLVGLDYEVLSPKRHPKLSAMLVALDCDAGLLLVTESPARRTTVCVALSDTCSETSTSSQHPVHYSIPVADTDSNSGANSSAVHLRAKTATRCRSYPDAVNAWFSAAVGVPCMFLRRSEAEDSDSLSNTAPLLVVHEESHMKVMQTIDGAAASSPDGVGGAGVLRGSAKKVTMASYRANLVLCAAAGHEIPQQPLSSAVRTARDCNGAGDGVEVDDATPEGSSTEPFVELSWKRLSVATDHAAAAVVLVASGPCRRCQQVNVSAGSLSHQPLAAIAFLCRRWKLPGVVFGQLFDVCLPTTPSGCTDNSNNEWDKVLRSSRGGVALLFFGGISAALSVALVTYRHRAAITRSPPVKAHPDFFSRVLSSSLMSLAPVAAHVGLLLSGSVYPWLVTMMHRSQPVAYTFGSAKSVPKDLAGSSVFLRIGQIVEAET